MQEKLDRFITEYSKEPPHAEVRRHEINCSLEEMSFLFDLDGDSDMIFTYQIASPDQVEFFKDRGVDIELKRGYFYVESN